MRLSKLILSIGLILSAPFISAKGWDFNLAPYVWLMNMNGDTGVANARVHVDENFSDLVKELQGGAMLWFEANNDRVGLFANALYAVLDANTDVAGFTIHSKEKFGLYTLGASYVAYRAQYKDCSKFEFTPYVGARITTNDVSIDVRNTNLSVSNNHTWTDPIIGMRLDYAFNKYWQIIGAADIGGTNFNTHKSYNLNAFIGYTPYKSMPYFTFYLGYRWLNQHYETGSGINYFLWNMKLFGPILGFNFAF